MKEFRSERTPPKGGPVGQAYERRDKPMRAKTFAEHRIRARAAVQYPGWRVDFVGPATIALTHIMGMERVIEVKRHRRRRDGPIMTAAKWIVPAVIWLLGMWMVAIVVMATAMGVRL